MKRPTVFIPYFQGSAQFVDIYQVLPPEFFKICTFFSRNYSHTEIAIPIKLAIMETSLQVQLKF